MPILPAHAEKGSQAKASVGAGIPVSRTYGLLLVVVVVLLLLRCTPLHACQQWRARRYDKVLGSLLFVGYVVTGVLLFAIPAAIYN